MFGVIFFQIFMIVRCAEANIMYLFCSFEPLDRPYLDQKKDEKGPVLIDIQSGAA